MTALRLNLPTTKTVALERMPAVLQAEDVISLDWLGLAAEMFDALPCAALLYDRRGRLARLNAQAARILTYSDGTGNGNKAQLALTLEALEPIALQSRKEVVGHSSAERCCSILMGGHELTLALSTHTLKDGEWLVFVRDASAERLQLETQEKARRTQALADISALLAQEVRTPLTTLELFASLIETTTKDKPDALQWVDHLQSGLKGLSCTVNNILSFYSQVTPTMSLIHIGRVLHDLVEFLRPMVRQRGIQVTFHDAGRGALVKGDAAGLHQLFLNLCLNGLRVLRARGALRIQLGIVDDSVCVEVTDNGRGIDSADLGKIFEAGFSTDAASSGLGLAVCRQIAEQHNGEISVESKKGVGTTFRVFIPQAIALSRPRR